MVMKKCIICGKEFNARGNAKCCSPECSKTNELNYNKEYNQSDKGKARIKKYQQSDKGKAALYKSHKKYIKSDKGKAANKRYRQSDKGKLTKQRYNQSDKCKEYQKEYTQNKIAELNEVYDGDLDLILKDCPTSWIEREAKMQVWFNESYYDGIIAKIKSTPVCEVTGEKTNDLVIHHLYSFNTHPELGNDPANMVRISKEVHKAFHSIYGYGNNTPEQWMDFIEKQYGGD